MNQNNTNRENAIVPCVYFQLLNKVCGTIYLRIPGLNQTMIFVSIPCDFFSPKKQN